MDEWGFLSVIVSIILGLSITQLLEGISQLINERDRVSFYGPAVGWCLLLLVIDVQAWWAMFGYRDRHVWTFAQFGTLLLEVILLYLLAALALPNITGGEGQVDLRRNYFRHKGWFFGFLVLLLLDSLLKSVLIGGHLLGGLDLGFHVVWLVTASIAAMTNSPRYHQVAFYGSFALMLSYIGLLFTTLR